MSLAIVAMTSNHSSTDANGTTTCVSQFLPTNNINQLNHEFLKKYLFLFLLFSKFDTDRYVKIIEIKEWAF